MVSLTSQVIIALLVLLIELASCGMLEADNALRPSEDIMMKFLMLALIALEINLQLPVQTA